MPSRHQIAERIADGESPDTVRRDYLRQLWEKTGRDTILYAAGAQSKIIEVLPSGIVSINNDDVQGFMSALHGLKGESLDLFLHSSGGSLDAAEQLVNYLRAKYKHIRAIVPQQAMSAATMMACACDVIVMGKQSALGPIDPQITYNFRGSVHTTGADYILREFEKALNDSKENENAAILWSARLADLPIGLLTSCERWIERSEEIVGQWLNDYMKLNKEKSIEIANWLGKVDEHTSHGRPIGYKLAESKGLNVELMEDDQEFQDLALSVFHSAMLTLEGTNCVKIIENHNGKGAYVVIRPPTLREEEPKGD